MTSARPGKDISSIYGTEYAARYRELYIDQWMTKHAVNILLIHQLLPEAPGSLARWLDVGCGPAWHFSKVTCPGILKIGLDISSAQLAVARAANPDASFVRADMTTPVFGDRCFGLVTSFWSPYSYLDSIDRVSSFIHQLGRWTATGGNLYLDVMLPDGVSRFGNSTFARDTGFSVERLSDDGTRWNYRDVGGDHEIVTPDIHVFKDCLATHFEDVVVEHDRLGFAHLVAMQKLD